MSSVTIKGKFVVVSLAIVWKDETVTAASSQFHRPPHFMMVMIQLFLVFVNDRQEYGTAPTT
jgi:hypothetical protein